MVYKLVEVDGMPVEKRSLHKESHGGRKKATRLAKPSGTVVEEVIYPAAVGPPQSDPQSDLVARDLTVSFVENGEPVDDLSLAAGRDRVVSGLHSLPWDGLKLSRGEPAIPTRMVPSAGRRA
jgi:nicotinate phosphoribosyltransferase